MYQLSRQRSVPLPLRMLWWLSHRFQDCSSFLTVVKMWHSSTPTSAMIWPAGAWSPRPATITPSLSQVYPRTRWPPRRNTRVSAESSRPAALTPLKPIALRPKARAPAGFAISGDLQCCLQALARIQTRHAHYGRSAERYGTLEAPGGVDNPKIIGWQRELEATDHGRVYLREISRDRQPGTYSVINALNKRPWCGTRR